MPDSREARLPRWAAEIEDAQTHCKHCGDLLTVCTALAYLGQNGSYFCDPETMEMGHEPRDN